jgi:hypothetical protein
MYESGGNFFSKFGPKKGGPLNTEAFDDDEDKEDGEEYDLDQFEDIKINSKGYSDTLEYNNKIYYKIPL